MLNGFKDWTLPSRTQLLKISNNLYKKQIGNFSLVHKYHHIPTGNLDYGYERIDFKNQWDSSDWSHRIRAIRYF